jgi:hypothetical protein
MYFWRATSNRKPCRTRGREPRLGHNVDHEFVGSTDVGFIDYKLQSFSKHGLVHLGDYHDILEGAQWTCTPVNAGDKVTLPENSKIPERVPIKVTLTVPSTAPVEAVEHLYERLLVVC